MGTSDQIKNYEKPHIDYRRAVDASNINKDRLKDVLARLVKQYGPIEKENAYSEVLSAHGISRIGSRLRRKLNSAFGSLSRGEGFVERNEFLWPPRDGLDLKLRKNNNNDKRDIEEIAGMEIAKAALLILSSGYKIKKEELIAEVARLFGFQRAGRKIQARVGKVIDFLRKKGMVQKDGDLILYQGTDIDGSIKNLVYN